MHCLGRAGPRFVCELHGYNIEGHIDTEELNKTGKLDKTVRRVRWEFQGGPIAKAAAKRQTGTLKLLTDTNSDGLMDKATVWADDLPPCYGIVPANGGIIVTCAPHIMFFADRDGEENPRSGRPFSPALPPTLSNVVSIIRFGDSTAGSISAAAAVEEQSRGQGSRSRLKWETQISAFGPTAAQSNG